MDPTNLQISPNNWFVGARSDQLQAGVLLRRVILGKPYVLFRTRSGTPAALEDNCPHKNLPLSMGRLTDGELQCRYHGWRFNQDGACTSVPCQGPKEKLPTCTVPSARVVEQDDWIWIHPEGPSDPTSRPPAYPKNSTWRYHEFHDVIRAPIDLFLENGVDCAHTPTVHPGLYKFSGQVVRATVKVTDAGVRIDTLGAAEQNATKEFRSLFSGRKEVLSYDEAILPHTVRQNFSTSDGLRIVTLHVCTPEDEHTTRVYSRLGVHYGRLTTPAIWYLRRITKKVIAEDKKVLEGQAENILRFGGRKFRTVTADLPMNWVQKAFRRFNAGESKPDDETREIQYRL